MGFNISGIVINENLENDLDRIESIFRKQLEFVKEDIWENHELIGPGDGFVAIYTKNNGTIIHYDDLEPHYFDRINTSSNHLLYIASETSMTFILSSCIDGKTDESIYYHNEHETGANLLNINSEEEDIIWDHIVPMHEKYLGGTNDEDIVKIYKLVDFHKPRKDLETKQEPKPIISPKYTPPVTKEKSFFTFWIVLIALALSILITTLFIYYIKSS